MADPDYRALADDFCRRHPASMCIKSGITGRPEPVFEVSRALAEELERLERAAVLEGEKRIDAMETERDQAMRFLGLQTESYLGCQAERDRLRLELERWLSWGERGQMRHTMIGEEMIENSRAALGRGA